MCTFIEMDDQEINRLFNNISEVSVSLKNNIVHNESFLEILRKWKYPPAQKFMMVLEDICKKEVSHDVKIHFFLSEIVHNMMDLQTDTTIRDTLIEIAFKLCETISITDLSPNEYQVFLEKIFSTYIPAISQLRDSNYQNWHKLWIFLVRFCAKKIHESMDLTNRLLRIVEYAFRNSSQDQRLKGYDCWRELIDNASLDPAHISNKKQIKLLVTPLKAKFSKQELVICKRFDIFVHLLEKLEQNGLLCITQFLEFCFGSAHENKDVARSGQAKSIPQLWTNGIKVLLSILGHKNNHKNCIADNEYFHGPVLKKENFQDYYKVILNSVAECCRPLRTDMSKFERDKIVSCIWKSVFKLILPMSEEGVVYFNVIVEILDNYIQLSKENQDYKSVLLSMLRIFVEFDQDLTHNCLPIVLKQFLTVFLTVYDDSQTISEHVKQMLTNYFSKVELEENKIKVVNVILECLTSLNKDDIQLVSFSQIWILLANELSTSFLGESMMQFSKFNEFFMWPLKNLHHFDSSIKKQIVTSWIKIYKKSSMDSDIRKIEVLKEFEKTFKDNPLTSSNIISLLSVMTQFETKFLSEFVIKLMEIVSLVLQLPNLSTEDEQTLTSLVMQFFDPSLECYATENNNRIIKVISSCIEQVLSMHHGLKLIDNFVNFFKSCNISNQEQFTAALKDNLSQLYSKETDSNSTKARELLKCLSLFTDGGKETEDHTKTFTKPSGRSARIATMGKNSPISPSRSSKTLRLFGKDLETMSPLKVKGSQLNNKTPTPKKKSANVVEVNKPNQRSIFDENSEDFVLIDSEVKLEVNKMNEHQKEVLKKRREDIPALYQDLSQSCSQDLFGSKSNSKEATDQKIKEIPAEIQETESGKIQATESLENIVQTSEEENPEKEVSSELFSSETARIDKERKRAAELKRLKMDIVGMENFLETPRRTREKKSKRRSAKASPTKDFEKTPQTPKPKSTPAKESTKAPPSPVKDSTKSKPTPVKDSTKSKPTPVKESTKSKPTPVKESTKSKPTPVKESTKSKPTPVKESTKAEPTPVKESTKSKLTPFKESSKAEPTPVKESTKSKPTPVKESTKAEPTPVKESTKSKPTPVKESTKAELTPVKEFTKSKPTPVKEFTEAEPTPMDMELSPKKKRGRKPKSMDQRIVELDEAAAIVNIFNTLGAMAKQETLGAQQTPTTDSASDTSVVSTDEKRGRGRPKKILKPILKPKKIWVMSNDGRRGRGRPKKTSRAAQILQALQTNAESESPTSLKDETNNEAVNKSAPEKRKTTDEETEDFIESSQDSFANIVPLLNSSKKKQLRVSVDKSSDTVMENENRVEVVPENTDVPNETVNTTQDTTITQDDSLNEADDSISPDPPKKPQLTESDLIICRMDTMSVCGEKDIAVPVSEDNNSEDKLERTVSINSVEDILATFQNTEESPGTPEKSNTIPSSPITAETPNRTNELLDNTVDISPIASRRNSEEDSPVAKSLNFSTEEEPAQQEVVPEEKDDTFEEENFSEDFETVEASSEAEMSLLDANEPQSVDQEEPPIQNGQVSTTINILSGKKDSLQDQTKVPGLMNSIAHKPFLKRKGSNTSSPSTLRIKKLMNNIGQKEHIQEIVENFNENDILTFSREIPSPMAVPRSGILKRKFSEASDGEGISPCPKRKRVNFSDPCLTSKKVFIKDDCHPSLEAKRLFDLTPDKKLSDDYIKDIFEFSDSTGSMETSTETDSDIPDTEPSLVLVNPIILQKDKPVFPKLIDCKDEVLVIVKKITSPMFVAALMKKLDEKNVKTVGDLAKLSEAEVNRFPFKVPVVANVIKALENYYKKKGYTSSSNEESPHCSREDMSKLDINLKLQVFVQNALREKIPLDELVSAILPHLASGSLVRIVKRNCPSITVDTLEEKDIDPVLKTIVKSKNVSEILTKTSEIYNHQKTDGEFNQGLLEYVKKTIPISEIFKGRSIEDLETGIKEIINNGTLEKRIVVDRCLFPLLETPRDLYSYLNGLSAVQFNEIVLNRLENEKVGEFLERIVEGKPLEDVKEFGENILMKQNYNSTEIVTLFRAKIQSQPEESKKEALVEMFRFCNENLDVSTLMQLHIEFLKRISDGNK